MCVDRNVWGPPRHCTPTGALEHSLARFKQGLTEFYNEYEEANPSKVLTRIQEFTTEMVKGKGGHWKMQLKAAETKWLCFYVHRLLMDVGDVCPLAAVWRRASGLVVRHVTIMDENDWVLPRPAFLDLLPGFFRPRMLKAFSI